MTKAFTLAEVLITLAIIGVVAALTIPSVIVNTQQQEFKTGLKKAVSVLNSAITMNKALDGESPYDTDNLFEYLQRHMSVIKSTNSNVLHIIDDEGAPTASGYNNAFYTTDGMRFEIGLNDSSLKLHETDKKAGSTKWNGTRGYIGTNRWCGSYGLDNNPDETVYTPCVVLVDVNGDRKPTTYSDNTTSGAYLYPDINDKKLKDIFNILITDTKAIPYGVVAQRAVYSSK